MEKNITYFSEHIILYLKVSVNIQMYVSDRLLMATSQK